MTNTQLTARQRQVLECIEASMRDRGYPPSVREIGESVGLTSPSSVHAHLSSLQKMGYLRRDPTKRDAFELYHNDDATNCVFALASFEKLWSRARRLHHSPELSPEIIAAQSDDANALPQQPRH